MSSSSFSSNSSPPDFPWKQPGGTLENIKNLCQTMPTATEPKVTDASSGEDISSFTPEFVTEPPVSPPRVVATGLPITASEDYNSEKVRGLWNNDIKEQTNSKVAATSSLPPTLEVEEVETSAKPVSRQSPSDDERDTQFASIPSHTPSRIDVVPLSAPLPSRVASSTHVERLTQSMNEMTKPWITRTEPVRSPPKQTQRSMGNYENTMQSFLNQPPTDNRSFPARELGFSQSRVDRGRFMTPESSYAPRNPTPYDTSSLLSSSTGVDHYSVKFKYFSASYTSNFSVDTGDFVIVQGDRGVDMGMVVRRLPSLPPSGAKMIIRKASRDEIKMLPSKYDYEVVARRMVVKQAAAFDLPIRITDIEWQYDYKRITVYFMSDSKVDFRPLIRELYREYKARIWMHHVNTPPLGCDYL